MNSFPRHHAPDDEPPRRSLSGLHSGDDGGETLRLTVSRASVWAVLAAVLIVLVVVVAPRLMGPPPDPAPAAGSGPVPVAGRTTLTPYYNFDLLLPTATGSTGASTSEVGAAHNSRPATPRDRVSGSRSVTLTRPDPTRTPKHTATRSPTTRPTDPASTTSVPSNTTTTTTTPAPTDTTTPVPTGTTTEPSTETTSPSETTTPTTDPTTTTTTPTAEVPTP